MFDQSLSVNNFKVLYNLDRKNKGNLEKDHFPEAYRLRLKIKLLKGFISKLSFRHKSGRISSLQYEKRKNIINEHINIRKETLNKHITHELSKIAETVNKKGYALPLTKSTIKVKGKEVYSIGKDVETIFVSRHVQRVLSSIYNVKVNNRDLIISRLSKLASDNSPKFIIRADVEKFYESIQHKALLDILHSSPKLSVTPRRILTQLVRSYASLVKNDVGLPRGVGISAFLSEIYMSDVDKEISELGDVTYYERYVDDLIVIFSPTRDDNTSYYLTKINKIIEDRHLNLNNKTNQYDIVNNTAASFEYLGYKFQIANSKCIIKLGSKKKDKIKSRIEKSIEIYDKEKGLTPNLAYKNLVLRIKFLTGNTRLLNNKSKAFVGVYFSNKFINDTSDLRSIDGFFINKLNNLNDYRLKKRLTKMSFEKGFNERIFRKFNIVELSQIAKGWKDD
ncbi:antiviral reverse transcriptase Drt3a [Vibrio harveyi]|uniref:antiviral reverse transcriptase Drt3a n=1 Tax=Vibrio harveyi TaxID=669 RepID=UPI00211A0563|nr:RNA-directed DNA polymerase [Vibrio harveyi]